MKKIANIISQTSVDVSEIFNVVKSMDEIIPNLPTLIIDYDYVNKNFPDFDISESYLGDNLYWTFKKAQKRDKYAEDLENFINIVYINLLKGVNYLFIDLIQHKRVTLIRIIRKINSLKDIVTFMHGDMIYIYSDNIVFGLDLKLVRFLDMDSDKIKNKIFAKSTVFLDDSLILIEYKTVLEEIQYQFRYIPYLASIIHEKNYFSSVPNLP